MEDNYKIISSLGTYIGPGSKIIANEFDSQIGYDNFPIMVIKSDGSKFRMHCTYELTEQISEDINIVKSLVFYSVIDLYGEIYISEINDDIFEIETYDYILEFHSMDETVQQLREAEKLSLIEEEKQKIKDIEYEKKNKVELEVYATHYYNLGLNVTCISNHLNEHNFYCRNILKNPNHKWKHLFKERQSKDEYRSYDWENATGLGTVTSEYYDIRVIDLDGCSNYEFLEEILKTLKLPVDYEWVCQSGSNNGYHIYVRCEKFDNLDEEHVVTTFPPLEKYKSKFDRLEILWNTHVVLPPSIHNSGGNYSFLSCKYPKSMPTVINIGSMSNLIDRYLKAEKKTIGKGYGDVLFEFIPPNLPNNIDNINNDLLLEKNIICIIDIETDGLPKTKNINGTEVVEYPNVIQIAWVLMDVDGIVYKKSSELLNFQGLKYTEAFEINKLNVEIIKKIGKNPSDVYKMLNSDLRISKYIAAHNSSFDIPIIKNELRKYSVPNIFGDKRIICTMKETIQYCSIDGLYGKLKNPKLTELYLKLFNYDIEQNHNAESDALITAKCLKELLARGIITI